MGTGPGLRTSVETELKGCSLADMNNSVVQMPPHAAAFATDLSSDTTCRLARLTFIPHERKIAVINARAAPTIHGPAAAMIHLFMQIGNRAAFAAHRQRLGPRKSRHDIWD